MANNYLEKNDMFSQLNSNDLNELLHFIDNYYIEYRDLLNIDPNLTFGIEIEYERLLMMKVKKFLCSEYLNWRSKGDRSLKNHFGGEISSSVLTDEKKNWIELKQICDYLNSKKVDTSMNAGGHIHMGAGYFADDIDAWRLFLKLYMAYEFVLYRFICGDKICERKGMDIYARPISLTLHGYFKQINNMNNIEELKKCLPNENRNYAVNFRNIFWNMISFKKLGNTIEFRGPNATSEEIIWQNNINTYAKMMMSSKNKIIDEDFLNYVIKHDFIEFDENKERYRNVNLRSALEFVDLVFNNNLDKINFLTQYFKKFENNYGFNRAVKSKRFIKK